MAEVCLHRVVPQFPLSQLLQAPKGHYVELNFTLKISDRKPCSDDMYLEFRDGYNVSANLLGRFCGRNISGIVRSSGHQSNPKKLFTTLSFHIHNILVVFRVTFTHKKTSPCLSCVSN